MSMQFSPLRDAVREAERGFLVYGQVQITGSYVVLRKGEQKRTWIEGQDEPNQRSIEVTIIINPIAQSGYTQLVTRSMISGSTGEFAKIVWPSLRDKCGLTDIENLDNQFVKAELVKNGRKWMKNGEEQEGTTFKFHAIYADEAACVAGYEADGNKSRATDDSTSAAATVDMSQNGKNPEAPKPHDTEAEREFALQFLPALVKQANGNRESLSYTLANVSPVNKFFTIDSPEVAKLITA